MNHFYRRREFLAKLGVGAAALPFLTGLPEACLPVACLPKVRGDQPADAIRGHKKQRVIIMFSPNGVVQDNYWPETEGSEFEITPILEPLADFKERMLLLHGVSNKVRGDGDSHMRGMSCLLTGAELLPGNIQGGSDTPAGWASDISVDQELKTFLQSQPKTSTRFGSVEFGVEVRDEADPWTRMCYAGENRPVAPVSDPYAIFKRMYGRSKDDDMLRSVLDDVKDQLKTVGNQLGPEAKEMMEEHQTFVSEMQRDLRTAAQQKLDSPAPNLEDGVAIRESNMPKISRMQIDLLVNGFANDMNRVATLQFSNSVGQIRMKWLGINEPHHQLSHDPDMKEDSQKKLTNINQWYAGEMHYLLQKLADTKDPGTDGSLLDNTLVIWTNELGKGNSHTLQNIPMLLAGSAGGFKMGRYLKLDDVAHNRLWMSLASAFGHELESFGKKDLCEGGKLNLA